MNLKKSTIKFLAVLALVAASAFASTAVLAQNGGGCNEGFKMENGLCIPESSFNTGIAGSNTWGELVSKVLKLLLTVAGVIAVVFIVIGGFQYLTAGGNDEQAEKGRKALTNAAIGLVIVMLAYALVNIIVDLVTK